MDIALVSMQIFKFNGNWDRKRKHSPLAISQHRVNEILDRLMSISFWRRLGRRRRYGLIDFGKGVYTVVKHWFWRPFLNWKCDLKGNGLPDTTGLSFINFLGDFDQILINFGSCGTKWHSIDQIHLKKSANYCSYF